VRPSPTRCSLRPRRSLPNKKKTNREFPMTKIYALLAALFVFVPVAMSVMGQAAHIVA